MSWTASCTIEPGTTPDDLDVILAEMPVNTGTMAPAETDSQFRAAKECAKQLIYSGAFGPLGSAHGYSINLSGHANPNQTPLKGWSRDSVTVSVSIKQP